MENYLARVERIYQRLGRSRLVRGVVDADTLSYFERFINEIRARNQGESKIWDIFHRMFQSGGDHYRYCIDADPYLILFADPVVIAEHFCITKYVSIGWSHGGYTLEPIESPTK